MTFQSYFGHEFSCNENAYTSFRLYNGIWIGRHQSGLSHGQSAAVDDNDDPDKDSTCAVDTASTTDKARRRSGKQTTAMNFAMLNRAEKEKNGVCLKSGLDREDEEEMKRSRRRI
jgi:hypothetical protein